MRIIVIVLLLAAAHYSLTPLVPAEAGKAWFGWPFAADSRAWLPVAGSLTQLLAVSAGLILILAILSLLGWLVPMDWWSPLVIVGAAASLVLYSLHFGLWAILPMVIDVLLIYGVMVQDWSVALLSKS